MSENERRWWKRFERALRDMPDGLVAVVTSTGSVTLHGRVDGTKDNEREPLEWTRGEYRIYADGERMR